MEATGNITIFEPISRFKKVDISLIENENIDCTTLGVYTKLIVLGKKWNLNVKGLRKHLGLSDEKVRKALSMLEQEGYIVRTPYRNEKGQLVGWNYTIYPTPVNEDDRSQAGLSKDNPQLQIPTTPISDHSDNGGLINNRLNQHIDLNNNKEERDKSLSKKKASNSAWRADIEVYRKEVEDAKEQLINDTEFKANFMNMYPNADYLRSIMKSMQYWTSEKAWELKKKGKSRKINMLTTLKNNLEKSVVYKNNQDEPIENLRMLNVEYKDKKEGTLADGTFIKGAYRYYFSYREKRALSIPINAPMMPSEKCEYDYNSKNWYLPRESETINDLLW